MASDFGDDAGEQFYYWMERIGERAGARAMERAAEKLVDAIGNARDGARTAQADVWTERSEGALSSVDQDRSLPELAKLDMSEFQELEGYDEIRGAIDSKLNSSRIPHDFLHDKGGTEFLVFRIADAPDLSRAFDDLASQARDARDRATVRGGERLDEKAARARAASRAMFGERDRQREPSRERPIREDRSK